MGRARRLAGGTGLGGSLGPWAAGMGFGDLPLCCGRAPAWGTSCGLADFDYVRTWADGSRRTLRRHSPSAPKPRQCSAVFAGAWPGRAQPAPPMGALECHIASITPPSGKLVLDVSAPMTKRSTKPDRSCKDQHDKKVGGHARLRQMVTAYTGSAHACRHSRSHRARRTTDQTFGFSRAPTAPAMGHAQQWMPKPSHPCYARRTQPYQRTT